MEQKHLKMVFNTYTIRKYNDDYYKMVYYKYPIPENGYIPKYSLQEKPNIDKLDNSLSRSRAKIFEYAMCNSFDYFVTLTLSPELYDRYNLEVYIKDLGQFIRDYRKKYKSNVQYELIPEKHKDGAWHIHGLIKGILPEHITKNKNGYMDFALYSSKFGYCSLAHIKSRLAVSKYITKYIRKSVGASVTELNKKSYYCSRGLLTSEVIKKDTLPAKVNVSYQFENDYIKIAEFTKSDYLAFIQSLT